MASDYNPKHNHGTAVKKAEGHTIECGYGKDDSDIGGGVRVGSPAGGARDLSHSLTGSRASKPSAAKSGGSRKGGMDY